MRKTCLDTIFEIAKKNNKVLFIGSDLGPGVLDQFKKKIPSRFFMEGVSEQSIIGVAAGLAMEGFKPYVNTISTFLTRRCFEQIVVDLCMHNLPVKLVGNGGGLVYAPLGPTHQAIEDISIMRAIPNMSIISPCDKIEMRALMIRTQNVPGPVYIRIARGGEEIITKKNEIIKFGKGNLKIKPKKYLIISTGVMTQLALQAAKILNKKNSNNCGVIHLGTVKPLDKKILKRWVPKVSKIITLEENVLAGGFGSSILEFCSRFLPNSTNKIHMMGLEDKFMTKYGTQVELLKMNKLTINNIIKNFKLNA